MSKNYHSSACSLSFSVEQYLPQAFLPWRHHLSYWKMLWRFKKTAIDQNWNTFLNNLWILEQSKTKSGMLCQKSKRSGWEKIEGLYSWHILMTEKPWLMQCISACHILYVCTNCVNRQAGHSILAQRRPPTRCNYWCTINGEKAPHQSWSA